jgi:hypothetical protein
MVSKADVVSSGVDPAASTSALKNSSQIKDNRSKRFAPVLLSRDKICSKKHALIASAAAAGALVVCLGAWALSRLLRRRGSQKGSDAPVGKGSAAKGKA